MKAILFDLDETLMPDEPLSHDAFLAAAELALPLCADQVALAARARELAARYWREGPCYEYCRRIGHSAAEVLWTDYPTPGGHPEVDRLRAWAPGYRVAIWRAALAHQPSAADALALQMAERFASARRRFPLYPEVPALLHALRRQGYRLGVVTNGIGTLQRAKLNGGLLPDGSTLAAQFDAIAISGEIDCGKPEPGIFHHVAHALGVAPADCVMVGDNPDRDVAGAEAAGMKSVWVSRNGRPRDPAHPGDLACTDLSAILPRV
ncbi:MAG: HAD family hydrolase [Mycobacterium leprae]